MNRIPRPLWYMEHALLTARRSTCMRLNVGAVIVAQSGGRPNIVAHGYNGTPSGEPHCAGNDCTGRFGCSLTIHAEDNAMRLAGLACVHADLYTTHSPCADCALMIMQRGIERVFFQTPYRKIDHLEQMIAADIEVYQINPAGYILRLADQSLVDAESL